MCLKGCPPSNGGIKIENSLRGSFLSMQATIFPFGETDG